MFYLQDCSKRLLGQFRGFTVQIHFPFCTLPDTLKQEKWGQPAGADCGPEGDRTELLSIIRNTLTELFTEYRDLKVREQRWFDGQWVPRKTLERFGVLEPEWEEGSDGEVKP